MKHQGRDISNRWMQSSILDVFVTVTLTGNLCICEFGMVQPSGSCSACFVFVFRVVPKLFNGSGRVVITRFFQDPSSKLMNFWELCNKSKIWWEQVFSRLWDRIIYENVYMKPTAASMYVFDGGHSSGFCFFFLIFCDKKLSMHWRPCTSWRMGSQLVSSWPSSYCSNPHL